MSLGSRLCGEGKPRRMTFSAPLMALLQPQK